ncbi:unnamed protein product, partial [Didymodactylos carnosus]
TLQAKFKRQRKPLAMTNDEVKAAKEKFSRESGGRPVKRKDESLAERRTDSLLVLQGDESDDATLMNQMTLELEQPEQDLDKLKQFWKSTLKSRRDLIRKNKIADVLQLYPAYKIPELVSRILRNIRV